MIANNLLQLYACGLMLMLCRGQNANGDEKGFLLNRRPLHQGASSGLSPCSGGVGGYDYDSVDPDQRSLLLPFVGGAAVGGVLGGAAGYHLGMKNQKQPIVINNNVVNQLPSPCYSVPVHVTTGGGGGPWGGGGGGGGGIVGGILSNHPILSNILQGGGLLGGGGNRLPNRSINRSVRQFRRVVRPVTRIFK